MRIVWIFHFTFVCISLSLILQHRTILMCYSLTILRAVCKLLHSLSRCFIARFCLGAQALIVASFAACIDCWIRISSAKSFSSLAFNSISHPRHTSIGHLGRNSQLWQFGYLFIAILLWTFADPQACRLLARWIKTDPSGFVKVRIICSTTIEGVMLSQERD